ncbi:hypothetical protein EL22_17665 [Halostagnicola sp. A56]|uniref:hypothetical protein n=1 Tax=Halostagnicola sp. A56 TaxID=1495067 RepID=UPI0004A108E3|nr:hypothetical protein EL22_17665 [Halostagnicola sp. A56]
MATIDETDGFVTIVAAEDGRVLGARIVAPEASELIGEIGVAIESETTVAELAATVHTHPALSESIREAAANVAGRAIHTPNR